MKPFVFFLFIINLWCCPVKAIPQEEPPVLDTNNYTLIVDSMPINNEGNFGDLKTKYNTPEFNYNEAPQQNQIEHSSVDFSLIGDIINFLFTYLLPLILGVLLIIGVYKLILYLSKSNTKNLIRSKDNELISTEHHIEDIHEIDFNKQIEKALQNKAYTEAIRWSYLLNLKIMDDHHIIKWEPKKTNRDYYYDINAKHSNIRKDFKYLTYLYDNIWFGKFSINEIEAKQILLKFNQFKSLINTL